MGSPVKVGKVCEPFAMGGNKVMSINYFTGPASYTTGGDAITARDLGLSWIHEVFSCYAEDGASVLIPVFAVPGEPVTQILAKIASIAGVEVGNGTNQTAKKFRLVAIGTY